MNKCVINILNAQIVLSDDYIDGNRADRTVLNYLWHLKKDLGAILLRGNHEQMPLNFMDQNDPLCLFNGGYATLKQLLGNVSLKSARNQFKTTSRGRFYHFF